MPRANSLSPLDADWILGDVGPIGNHQFIRFTPKDLQVNLCAGGS